MEGIISTSGINGAGLKKWIPITLLGFLHADAIDAIDKEEVLVEIIHSSSTIDSISDNTSFFICKFSTMASITRELFLTSFILVVKLILDKISFLFSSFFFAFFS